MQSYQLNGLSENDEQYRNKYLQWLQAESKNYIQRDYEIYLDQTTQNIEYQGNQVNTNQQASYTQIRDLIKDGEQLHLFNSNICVCYNQYQKIIQVTSVHHKMQVKNGIAINKKTITFNNDENRVQNIHFLTQVPKNVTVISISANLGKNQFKTVVKERETEKAQGKSQFYEDFSDIVNFFIGQVQPFQQIQLTYEYLEILKVKYNKLWMIQIQPLLEKYSQAQIQYLTQYFQYDNQCRQIYDLNIEIEFDNILHFYRSPSHQIVEQIVVDKQILSCNIYEQEQMYPFILLFQFHEQHKPLMLLTQQESQGKQNYCATIQILPELNQIEPNEAYNAFQQDANIDVQEFSKNSKGEYLFILDRSQSMDGQRLDKAKQALILFLRSLPLDSFYNIISFGYGFLYRYSQTARYSEDNINQSIAYINQYIANYGGTNISYAIEAALKLKRIKGYNRNIFLLTDGESEIEPVLKQIQDYSKPDVRFYTIGMGQDCNQYLMEKIAFLGNGMWGIINDNSDLNSVVITMLSDSIVHWYSNFKISSNIPKDQIQMISTQLQKVNVLQKNQPIIIQIIFNLKEEEKQGNYFQISYQEQNKQEQVIQIPIDNTNTIESNIMHKMAVKQETQKIQEFARMQENEIENLGQIDRAIDKKELEQLSVNYQVITPFTTVQSQVVGEQEQENQLCSQINQIEQKESINQNDQCSQINQLSRYRKIIK